MKELRRLIVQMAEENPSWGYARIQGALRHLDHRVARSTIAKTLKEHGLGPAPDRPMSWATFVGAHAHLIAAAEFFTTEVWTARGLVTHYTLVVINIATRCVQIAGSTTSPAFIFRSYFFPFQSAPQPSFLPGSSPSPEPTEDHERSP